MIIKTNLASKPTQNHTLYFLGCLLLVAAVIAFTSYNITNLLSAHSKNSGLAQKIEEQRRVRSEAQKEAVELQRKIATIKTPEFVKETEFLNNAIKRRVFSWTGLFDRFEALFPNDVKMISVYPDITGDETKIRMEVSVKTLDNIVELTRLLQQSPYFTNVVVRSETQEKDSLLHFSMSLEYKADISSPPSSEASAKSPKDLSAAKEEKAL